MRIVMEIEKPKDEEERETKLGFVGDDGERKNDTKVYIGEKCVLKCE